MARVTVGAGVQAILDYVKVRVGERVLTAEQAKSIFGGSKEVAIADLSPVELLQYALIEAYAWLEEAESEKVANKGNRATRRAKK